MSHIFAGTGTCLSFREYFSLGGCGGPVSYKIFVCCTAVIVIQDYFHLGGCLVIRISNVICGDVVTHLSLELDQWYCWKGLFSMKSFSRAHH